ncbi:MAG: hypothetical protein ACKVPY_05820 [Paracoccaceae bacterium]
MARRYKAARIKADRAYSVDELAEAVGATPQTVRHWVTAGLPVLAEKRPFLVLGWQAKHFLATREAGTKRPLQVGEFYCLRCKAPVRAAFGLCSYSASSPAHGRIEAFCERCDGPCGRIVSRAELSRWVLLYPELTNAEAQA